MSIKLCQAANSVVTPLDDAQLYSWIANRAVGVVTGCVVTSAGTNQLSISAGWGIVQGHVFTIGAETIAAAVAPSGTVNGRLLIRIDTSDADTPVQFVTQAATPLPALTQEDIDGSGSIYELPLATYTVGTISISDLVNVAPSTGVSAALAAYPVGSIYMSVNSTNPTTLFGGTWTQIKDKFLLSAGDTYSAGATGGEAAHALTASELADHFHRTYSGNRFVTYENIAGGSQGVALTSGSNAQVDWTTGAVSVSCGKAHNNMPPYLTVYVWQRTA